MLYLFSGDDAKNKIINYEKFIKSLPKDVEVFRVNRNDFDQVQIESFYSGSSLFSTKSAVVFSGILEYEETREFILEKLELMGKSGNTFVFWEGRLNKPILDTFRKARAELNVFELPKEKKEKFDNFLVANAFANKDKLNTWVYFRQAVDVGVVMEELIGVLFWKIKDMLLKKNFSKFSEEQLKNYVSKISYLLPEARKKGLDAESAFEQFLLEAF
ncbi:hypothetical protein A2356_02450 [Candidatus Nomurabacteria bacterium RIFOXYB1_FULL_39_16]|uniref:DNA polymerase III delta N-terminal domain-containing protein n=1 Tax=Candidatus Nomurabacteria bacterium RIFOXYB1_FULL_39_16 TaxID=1801803 RepID=A0A1F6YQX7_9BACT|nr:MAG: hypothetical protein A2356_02450 [Candidatus Nomurabacteria bacterium RIFOXYB1_FULL_39_16]OGJ14116.1 MAG: hypothetical protein A2585_01925 [Candidatus Nomurabacteria bacterium RIFOXYD1_FULL_39_12]